MEVIVGTYEELILGYKLQTDGKSYRLEPSFTNHSHIGCVRALNVSKRGVLASGSSDEVIHLFNLKKRVELGTLMHHEGSVLGVSFFGRNNFFSWSEDGTVGVWKVGRWECLRTLKGHKGAVHSVAVHPSGKLGLSIGKDKTLRIWDLMTAKTAYITNIKAAADHVLWSPGGEMYVIITNNKIDVYKQETATLHQTIQCDFRINAALFKGDSELIVAGEGGTVNIYNITTASLQYTFSTDTNRVKGMGCCACPEGDADWLTTASSDGFIKIWSLEKSKDTWKTELMLSHDTKFRLTCLAVYSPKGAGETGAQEQEEENMTEEEEAKDDDDGADDASEDDNEEEEEEEEHEETVEQKPAKQRKKRKHVTKNIDHAGTEKQKSKKVIKFENDNTGKRKKYSETSKATK